VMRSNQFTRSDVDKTDQSAP